MKINWKKWALITVSAFLLFLLPEKASYAQNSTPGDNSKEIIVMFKSRPTVSLLSALSNTTGQSLEIKNGITASNAIVFSVASGDVETAISEVSKDPNVQSVFPNYKLNLFAVPNDPMAAANTPQQQWNLYKLNLAGSGRSAWDVTTGSASVTVAVIDTGVDSTHPDLAGKIASLVDCSTGTCSVVTSMTDAYAAGHGTHVAGLVGAVTNNGEGIASVGYNSKLMVIKMMDTAGNAETDNFFNAIKWAADHGAKVINTSFGVVADRLVAAAIAEYDNTVKYAWDRGVVVVAAAGNCRGNTNGRKECAILTDTDPSTVSGYAVNSRTYPAASPKVISVAASTVDNAIASYSEQNDSSNTNIGNWISVAAPGGDGACTDSTKTCVLSTVPVNRYFWQSGTSMAAPHVAGIAALILAAKPGLTNDRVKNIIETTANKSVPVGSVTNFGLVDALAAVNAAAGTNNTATPTPTPIGITVIPSLTPTVTAAPNTAVTPVVSPTVTPTAGPTATPTVTPYPTVPPRLPKTPPNPYPQAPYCALVIPPPGPDCCNLSQINQNYKCIQDCGPLVGQAGDPPAPYRCLSPDEQKGIELADGKRARCPICLASNTTIATHNGNIRVTELKSGMSVWTVDRFGNKVSVPILKTSSVTVPSSHQIAHVVLSDGRNLWVSPGHPAANGKIVGQLKAGDPYDGSVIVSNNLQSYWDNKTYDILPAGDTGYYWANGILMGSTLK